MNKFHSCLFFLRRHGSRVADEDSELQLFEGAAVKREMIVAFSHHTERGPCFGVK